MVGLAALNARGFVCVGRFRPLGERGMSGKESLDPLRTALLKSRDREPPVRGFRTIRLASVSDVTPMQHRHHPCGDMYARRPRTKTAGPDRRDNGESDLDDLRANAAGHSIGRLVCFERRNSVRLTRDPNVDVTTAQYRPERGAGKLRWLGVRHRQMQGNTGVEVWRPNAWRFAKWQFHQKMYPHLLVIFSRFAFRNPHRKLLPLHASHLSESA
ncbi:hypothetical protein BamIOP4010DRAFT_6707 [Burkholderia ambifaria IOP40-10]|uniref:Uncharacterized protein n=1 Tax=Burkholderia ambifaria IOP40-10 TaxID=396596 RepID=B1FRP4_9BURK|nr:hypothetical protein BamIOP4010DRAFT_6707 [Burkholderia ambifaria IOP40-10]